MIKKKVLVVAVALASSTLLFGCGGGSSSSGKKSDSGSEVARISLTGMVAKGTISNAIVTAIELDKDGSEAGVVGTATTGADGRYELMLNANYKGGIVKLTVTATAGSQMVCDAFDGCGEVAFGQPLDLPEAFALNAYLSPSKSGKITAAVTPLTHMAAKRFEAGEKTPASLKVAVDSVSAMAGFDILATEPVDISKTDDVKQADTAAQAYALFNSGLASLIFTDGNVEAAIGKLDALAKSFEDGQLDANEVSDITSAIKTAASKASTQPGLSGVLTEAIGKINEAIAVIETGTDEEGNYNPEVPDTSDKTKLERGKEAIADLRAWINEIIDTHKTGGFESPARIYGEQLETVQQTFDGDTQAAAQLVGYLVEQLALYLDEGANVEELLTSGRSQLTIRDDANQELGVLSLGLTSTDGLTFTLDGELEGDSGNTVTVSDVVLKTNLPATSLENGVLKQFTGETAELNLSGSIESAETSLTLNSVSVKLEATEQVSIRDGEDSSSLEDKFKAASFSGDVNVTSGEHSFSGLASFELVRLDRAKIKRDSENVMSLNSISVNGTFSGPTGTLEAGAALSLTNGMSFDTFGFLDWSRHMWIELDVPGELPQLKAAVDAQFRNALGDEAIVISKSYELYKWPWYNGPLWINGYYVMGAEGLARYEACLADPVGWYQQECDYSWEGMTESQCQYSAASSYYTDVTHSFDYSLVRDVLADQVPTSILDVVGWDVYYSTSYDATFIGAEVRLDEFESEDYFAQGTLTLNTKVSGIADLPNVNLVATVSRDKARGGSANLALGWDNKLYRLEFRSDDVNPQDGIVATGTLVIRDNTGVVIELTSSDLDDNTKVTGTVKVDGEQIGTVDTRTGGMPIVRFTDGKETQFESLL